jgi:hypothetical protein
MLGSPAKIFTENTTGSGKKARKSEKCVTSRRGREGFQSRIARMGTNRRGIEIKMCNERTNRR